MSFIELTGATLRHALHRDELTGDELSRARITDECILRVNRQGDLEVRRPHGWVVVGGLLGGFDDRIRHATGLDWA